MELQANFDRRVNEIQRKLRECNYECNRLKELFSDALAQIQPTVETDLVVDQPISLIAKPSNESQHPQTPSVEGPSLAEGPESVEQAALTDHKAEEEISANDKQTSKDVLNGPEPVLNEPIAASVEVSAAVPPPLPPLPRQRTAAPAANRPPARGKKRPAAKKPAAKEAKPRRSMEKFIGENLLNKIGIGILVIGVGIFVKYAIDQDWIGHIGRVLIGVLTGGLLLGVAHYLRKKYTAFSSVLVGGGIATLYFSISIAFQTYGLMSQTLAFAVMSLITAFGVVMAIGYNRQEIGIIALLGGFATPFLVAKGDGSYVSLFSYLLILNLGAMALSWFRDWKIIRVLSYGLTVLMFGGWVVLNMTYFDAPVVGGTIAFATAFFVVFFAMNVAFSVKNKQKLRPVDFILLLSNSAFYYAATMVTLYWFDQGRYMGIFSAIMGVFHFAFIFPARKWVAFDDRLVKVLVGLVLTFVTAAVGIQLEGSHLTIFWAIEAVVLLVLARKTKMEILERATLLLTVLTIGSLLRDWGMFYLSNFGSGNSPILNGNFLTTLIGAGSLFAISALNKRLPRADKEHNSLSAMYRFFGIGLFYVGAVLETLDHVLPLGNGGLNVIAIGTLTVYYLIGLQIWAMLTKNREFGSVVFSMSMIFFVAVCAAQVIVLGPMREAYLVGSSFGDGFMKRFLMTPGMFALLGLSFVHGRRTFAKEKDNNAVLLWGLSILLVFITSLELDTLLAVNGISSSHAHKIGYPILWGVIGFGLIASGMKYKLRHLRLAGLALFLLIIVKLFVYDIRSIPTGGKIAAFISLGVLLLVVSFLYQRLKRLVSEDDPEEPQLQAAA